jgi:hypothetical protein
MCSKSDIHGLHLTYHLHISCPSYHNCFVFDYTNLCKLPNMRGSSWDFYVNTKVKVCEKTCCPIVLSILKTGAESDDRVPSLGREVGTWPSMQGAPKQTIKFSLLLCRCSLYVQLSFFLHPKVKCAPPLPHHPFFFHHTHIKAFYLSCKFWIQWRMIRGWNSRIIITLIAHSMMKIFHFSMKFQHFKN